MGSNGIQFPIGLFAFAVAVCYQGLVLRIILHELFPTPTWALARLLYGIAAVNFLVEVVLVLPVICAPRVRRSASDIPPEKKVSVIFPAYNEAGSIGDICRQALASTDNPNVEFIVVDDRSKDATWNVLQQVLKETNDPRFKPLAGQERGKVFWRGKNWAVWQGFEASNGDYLLFCDADVTLLPGAIEAFVARLEERNVGWMSYLPKTTFSCFAEYMFNWPGTCIMQALVPSLINRFGKVYAFGQCNLFTRQMYLALGGHREIGHLVAESHSLAQKARELKLVWRCELAYQFATLEWYHDFWECWNGQLKSLQARMITKHACLCGRPIPQFVVVQIATLLVMWQALPEFILLLQAAKLATTLIYEEHGDWADSFYDSDLHVVIASLACVACTFLKRGMGKFFLGYSMRFWWLGTTGSVLRACLAVCACKADTVGRWAIGTQPEGTILPREMPKTVWTENATSSGAASS